MEGSIPSLPDCLFASYDEAYAELKNHSTQHGYGFYLNKSGLIINGYLGVGRGYPKSRRETAPGIGGRLPPV